MAGRGCRPRPAAVWRGLLLASLVVVIVAAGGQTRAAAGEVVRVRAQTAAVYESARTGSAVVGMLPQGTLLEVLDREGEWLWVILPPDAHGTRRAGYIQSFLVEAVGPAQPGVVTRSRPVPPPTPPGSERAAGAEARRGRSFTWDGRYFVRLNGGYQTSASSFGDRATFPVYREVATAASDYHISRGSVFALSGGVLFGRYLSLGLGFTAFSRRNPVAVTGAVPHPFFFELPRPIAGQGTALSREERAIHPEVAIRVPLPGRIDLTVLAGPSVFSVRQDVVTAIRFTEVYPYDVALFDGVEIERVSKRAVGFHAGVDLAYPVWRFLGIGVGARFSRAEADLPASAHDVRVRAGGLQAVGGLRARF